MRAPGIPFGWQTSLMALTLLLAHNAVSCLAQQPILEVRLAGVGQILVQGRLTSDGTLELPVAPIEELTGEDLGEMPFLSIETLSEALGPQVEVDYDPRRALLLLRDPLGSLAATQELRDIRQAEARGTPANVFSGGPYGALTADIDGDRLLEGGWSFGWLALSAAHSTLSGGRWGLSVRPLPRTWLTYGDSEEGNARFGLRWAGGRTFVRTSYVPATEKFRGQAATSFGRWTAFLQEDGSAALTFRTPRSGQITVARTPDQYSTRLSFGRNPSPFNLPVVR